MTQENLAAATIAKIFGSELLHAQENARTDSGNQPQFLKIHPRDFLQSQTQQTNQNYQNERQRILLQQLQREAEASCPLPEPAVSTQPAMSQAIPTASSVTLPSAATNIPPSSSLIEQQLSNSTNTMERICLSLERIANRLEQVEITIKKARKRRLNK